MNRKKRRRLRYRRVILLILILIFSTCLLYPSVTQHWNKSRASRASKAYDDAVCSMSEEEIAALLKEADEYNERLTAIPDPLVSEQARIGYDSLLNMNSDGVMGWLYIPSLHLNLPIAHYTDTDSMSRGAGHMAGSSLPVGGSSTHAVLSAHCGMPDNELFTHLERLQAGDVFQITVLNRRLWYQIDQILTVLPEDDSQIQIEQNKDYVTLITCTPFGVNSHRLLVRGHRTDTVHLSPENRSSEITEKTMQKADPRIRIILHFSAGTAVILLLIRIGKRIRRKKGRKHA